MNDQQKIDEVKDISINSTVLLQPSTTALGDTPMRRLVKPKYTYIPSDDNTIDLWQEVRYQPNLFPDVTREHWGSRRACQMIVVAPPAIGRKERMVPLFSHANGSRMCGGKDTNTKKVKGSK